jgi:hypothetical protein
MQREAWSRGSSPPVDPTPDREPVVLDRWQVEELVDTVVARVERRVLEEIELRGLRRDPGVF